MTLREGVGVKLVATVGTRHETETVRPEEWAEQRQALLAEPFDQATSSRPPATCTRGARRRPAAGLAGQAVATGDVAVAAHDRPRGRALDLDDPEVVRLFIATGLAGDSGRIRAPHADKERQLQHYLELLRPLAVLQGDGPLTILDAGCGKAYMSLALVLYARQLGRTPALIGLDTNAGVVETVRAIADDLGYDATFAATSIADWTRRMPTRASTCSCRCTPATPPRTRRWPPASGSARARSCSHRAVTTSCRR